MVTVPPPERLAPARRSLLVMPATAMRHARRSATSSPGRLFVIGVALVMLALVTGVVGALAVQEKQDAIDNLIEHREPVAAASQQIYRSLSDADATAASAFLSGGTPPAALRERYELDIAQAGANLAQAAADVAEVPEAQRQVDQLAQQLPVYTGLVETARAYNRQGFPAGAAYLREASGLMRAKLLPAAEELYSIDFRRLADEQAHARAFPWGSTALVLVLLAALVATQLYLTRRTNRLLNIGLVVASGSVVVGLVWGSVALVLESVRIADGHDTGTRQVELAVQARIVALTMRANETLTLVARGDGGVYEEDWKELAPKIGGDGEENLLVRARGLAADAETTAVLDAARQNAADWLALHGRVRELDDGGSYENAIALAVGDGPDGAAAVFTELDANLLRAINNGRTQFVEETTSARAALTGLVPGIAVLSLLAAVGVTMGIRERLREYR
ncbi:hypothetical protein [Actinophytocola xanthii]|uniref:Secreted protein n=1 Tax=Actinophytocola xanthii TaxID=1912961 RepID=A0A1Q8CSN3_9PSEU|nr:hypothetical protein [Actinophytocola xanthii]OLF17379.1 hypothetical protein BU204_12275 [Actinophytocola xanthii]